MSIIPNIEGLIQKVQDAEVMADPETVKRLMRGRFTLEDLYNQLKSIKKVGKFREILAMMNLSCSNLSPPDSQKENRVKVKTSNGDKNNQLDFLHRTGNHHARKCHHRISGDLANINLNYFPHESGISYKRTISSFCHKSLP